MPVPPPRGAKTGSDFPVPPKAKDKPSGASREGAGLNGSSLPDQSAAVASLGPVRRADGAVKVTPPPLPDRSKLNEAESMTLFGERGSTRKERSVRPVLIGIAVVLLLAIAVWAGVFVMGSGPTTTASDGEEAIGLSSPAETVTEPVASLATTPEDTAAPEEVAALAPSDAGPAILQTDPELGTPGKMGEAPSLSGGDTAPTRGTTPSASAMPEADSAQPLPIPGNRDAAVSRYAALGIWQIPPDPPALPEAGRIDDMRTASLDVSLSLAMPSPLSPAPDLSLLAPPSVQAPPPPLAPAESREAPVATEEGPVAGPDAEEPDAEEIVAAAEPEITAPAPATETGAEADPVEGPVRVIAGSPSTVPPERPGRPESLRSIVPINPTDGPALRPRGRPGSATPDGQEETALEPAILQQGPTPPTAGSAMSATGTRQASTAAETPAAPGSAAGPLVAAAPVAALIPETALPEATGSPEPTIRPLHRPETVARLDSDIQAGGELGLSPVIVPEGNAAAAPRVRPLERPGSIARLDTRSDTGAEAAPEPEDTTAARASAAAAAVLVVPSPPSRPRNLASLLQPEATEPAAPAIPAAPEAEAEVPLPESAFAVASSPKPKSRPARLVQQAEKARKAASGPAVVASATVAPSGPTKASVAKSATEANMINLARLNLIGVYGSASDRRALVRLPSGRFVKVKVGDRVDGGRVASIGG